MLFKPAANVDARREPAPFHPRTKAAAPDPATLHPAIPRVLCPACGNLMRLVRIEPDPDPRRRAERTTFECQCGFDYRHTIGRRA